jgi:hypothetical protein
VAIPLSAAPVSLLLVFVAWRFLLWRYPATMSEVSLDLDSMEEPELPGRRERAIVAGLSLGAAVVNTGLAERMALELTFLTVVGSDLRPSGILIGLLGPAVIIAWVLLVSGFIR